MNELKQISNSGLHDYKVISVHIDNDTSTIEIALTDLHQKRVNILIDKFINLKISNREPWGKGTYIVSSDIQQIKDVTIMIIELNSGDIISIEFFGSISINSDL
ncbi:MAG: hypothetical protein IJ571_10280 [Ruminococcus sp.]|nr:hypothetical protein [Ruminococcus sp.]